MVASSHLAFALCGFALICQQASGSQFLGVAPPKPAMLPLLEELERIVGKDHRSSTESRAVQIEDSLRPIFHAMPKSKDGGIKPDAVRYMVHRYFVDRHGWFVDGLGAGADTSNNSSPSNIFKDQGDDVQELFEDRFSKHTFTLHQVAVFASALESFVHAETIERLSAAYRLLEINEQHATEKQVESVIEAYMVLYVFGANYSDVTPSGMRKMRAQVTDLYPTWKETKKWVDDVRAEVLSTRTRDALPTNSFNFSVKVLEEIGDRYGRWQNKECVDLKNALLKMEEADTGRVRLETFYGSALQGNWQFSESIGYLRELGAVDESDAQRPSVMIPNYINSPSNCVASSKFYSVCCIDECESLIGHLETRVAAPEASPKRIADLVANLPSPTVHTPRVLSASLIQKLDEIALHHHGTVPFHGRLFAQWMHHAFPRECSYPHMSGTLNARTPGEYYKQTKENPAAAKATMQMHIESAKQVARSEYEDSELPWTLEEEIFVSRLEPPRQENVGGPWAIGRSFAGLAAIFAVTLTIVRTFVTAKDGLVGRPNEKYFV